ncbi:alpha/beta fold hydrolase [Acidithrix sp. C25]|uniref:alpha/beta fold hydrolase n=1 Tax=Acidithrix sp. C25 TaxID=1671482 RepID=UPI00191BC558|nr:alpha/beta fold hydrolase [Acidithrix sp. C25]CAG4926436.1 unnamed protein product [Acidithrix sp. C25]
MTSQLDRYSVAGLGRLREFSHAAMSDDLIFVSGTLGTSEDLGLVDGGIGPQTIQCLGNIERILNEVGSSWNDVLKVSVFVADMANFDAMNRSYASFFDQEPPARITIGGVVLALGAAVEIECVARRHRPERVWRAKDIPRRTGFFDNEGESLYYEVIGEGGVPLILSHGAGGNHASWYQQVAEFARDRMVVTWDHRGYGRSSDRAGLSGPEVAARDLLALVKELSIGKADFVGQSMGGWSVVGAALMEPSLFRRLVLADTLGGFITPEIQAAVASSKGFEIQSTDHLGGHPALSLSFTQRFPDRAHLYQCLSAMGSVDGQVMIPRLLAHTHSKEDADSLTMAILCLVGDRDPLFPPRSIRALTDLLPDARITEITGCGHSPYFEDPQAWNFAVRSFLDRQ